MNKNTFINAMTQIDDSYIDEIMEKRARLLKKTDTRKPVLLMHVMPIAAAVAILAACVVGAFSMANRNKPEVPGADEPAVVPPVVDTDGKSENKNTEQEPVVTVPNTENTNTRIDGAYILEPGEIIDKFVADFYGFAHVNALSYYLKNEKIYITVGCTFYSNEIAKKLAQGENIFPENSTASLAKPSFFVGHFRHFKTQRPLINDCDGNFYKSFSNQNEMPYFGRINGECCYFEEIILDFSQVEPETTGVIEIKFGWNSSEIENNIWASAASALHYYVGESGVGLSLKSVEKAEENFYKVEAKQSTENNIETLETPKIQ